MTEGQKGCQCLLFQSVRHVLEAIECCLVMVPCDLTQPAVGEQSLGQATSTPVHHLVATGGGMEDSDLLISD